jgi:hypothetical protein
VEIHVADEGRRAMPITDIPPARRLWTLLEPIAACVYFAPELHDEAAALGYDVQSRWSSYFAWRAAPLGAAGPQQVASAFYSFCPRMVHRYVPQIWRTATPQQVLPARLAGVDRALRAIWGEAVYGRDMTEAAELARTAAMAADTTARPLAAAIADFDWPTEPHLVLWHAANLLRESRGDGHVAALLTYGLDPVESLVSFAAIGAAPTEVFASRGWSDQEWQAGRQRLADRQLVDASGTATEQGRRLRQRIEDRTDALAARPWRELGPATDRLAELTTPLTRQVVASGIFPAGGNTLGLNRPPRSAAPSSD